MSEENEVENIYNPEECRNFDVTGVVDRLDRVLYGLCNAESATINEFTEDDIGRFRADWAEVNIYITSIMTIDRLDLPHSYPAMYHFRYVSKDAGTQWEEVKNTFVRDVARLTANAMVQWSRSESADASNKYVPADVARWTKIYNRGVQMLDTYVAEAQPGDKPESSDFELEKRIG